MKHCNVLNCKNKYHGRGYCALHLARLRRHGDAKKTTKRTPVKHGLSNTPEYTTWEGMLSRCYNKKSVKYMYYGGRGITICDRWKENFPSFLEDMGNKPSKSHTLDRIDNDGNYEKSNCRWVTMTHQNRNTRSKKGIYLANSGKYRAVITANYKSYYLGSFQTYSDALKARIKAENKYWS